MSIHCTVRRSLIHLLAILVLLGSLGGAQAATARADGLRVTAFAATTQPAYSAWIATHRGAPPTMVSFPAFTTKAVAFYVAYAGAIPSFTTAQVLIYDTYYTQQGYLYATSVRHVLPYQDGSWMVLVAAPTSVGLGGGYLMGPYRADLLLDGHLATWLDFTVTWRLRPPAPASCRAHDVETVVSCDEASILRLEGAKVAGSGFVVRSDGTGTYVLTNRHVVALESARTLHTYAPDGRTSYKVLAIRLNNAPDGSGGDLAIVKLAPSSLHPLAWANAGSLAVGAPVVSIGYALDMPGPPTVTEGIISALGRDNGDGFGPVWIQHQSVINHGNSGGPLLTLDGQVAGVNTLGQDQTQGIFFAISSSWSQQVATRLIAQMAH
jgi:hypothetical protein